MFPKVSLSFSLIVILSLAAPTAGFAQDSNTPESPTNFRLGTQSQPSEPPAACNNDNILNVGEYCDDGNTNPHDGCHQCEFVIPSNGQIHTVNTADSDCSDSGNGQTQPWCSIKPMDSHTFVPGDSVVIRAGTYRYTGKNRTGLSYYNNADVEISGSGTAGNPIVIMAHPGEVVTLQNEPGGDGSDDGLPVIGSGGRNYHIFQGFRIEGSITLGGGSNSIVRANAFYGITSNNVGSNYKGFETFGGSSNLVRNNYFTGFRGDGDGNNAGIQLYGNNGGKNTIIENNHFFDNRRGIFDKDWTEGTIVRKNIFENNNEGLVMCAQYGCKNTQTYQNLFLGDNIASSYGTTGSMEGNTVRNNVFVNTVVFRHGGCPSSRFGAEFFNNVHIGSNTTYEVCPGTLPPYVNYNVYSTFTDALLKYADRRSFSQWQALGYDQNSTIANPQLSGTFYTPADGSPVKNAGRYGNDLGLYPDGNTTVVIGRARQ